MMPSATRTSAPRLRNHRRRARTRTSGIKSSAGSGAESLPDAKSLSVRCVTSSPRLPSVARPLGDLFDERDDVVATQTLFARIAHQLPSTCENEASFRGASHGDASSSLELEDAFIAQLMKGPKHGVGVHAEFCGEILGGWQSIAWCSLAI